MKIFIIASLLSAASAATLASASDWSVFSSSRYSGTGFCVAGTGKVLERDAAGKPTRFSEGTLFDASYELNNLQIKLKRSLFTRDVSGFKMTIDGVAHTTTGEDVVIKWNHDMNLRDSEFFSWDYKSHFYGQVGQQKYEQHLDANAFGGRCEAQRCYYRIGGKSAMRGWWWTLENGQLVYTYTLTREATKYSEMCRVPLTPED